MENGEGVKKRGRPPISAEPSELVAVKVPVSMYDALCRHAAANRMPMAQYVRESLGQYLSYKKSTPHTPTP